MHELIHAIMALKVNKLRTKDVVGLTEYMRVNQDRSRMPILADALEEAVCKDENILKHCRKEDRSSEEDEAVDVVLLAALYSRRTRLQLDWLQELAIKSEDLAQPFPDLVLWLIRRATCKTPAVCLERELEDKDYRLDCEMAECFSEIVGKENAIPFSIFQCAC